MASVASCCAATRCSGRTYDGHAAALRARVRRVWLARAHSQRQRRPVCEHRPRPLVAAVGLVDAPGHHPGADRASAIPNKTGRTNSFIPCSKRTPRGRPRPHRARPTTPVRSLLCGIQPRAARTRPCSDAVPASCYQPSRATAAARAAGARVSRAISKSVASRPSATSRGAARRCFSAKRWPAKTSPSKKSTTGSGRCALPPSPSVATTNVIAAFTDCPRSRRGAPPAPLAPRLT